MATDLIAVLAAAGMLGTSLAAVSGTLSGDILPPAVTTYAAEGETSGGLCQVQIARTGAPGSSEIVRQVLAGDECVCYMTTGPVGNNPGAEDLVAALLRERQCASAPLVTAPPPQFAPVVGAVLGAGALGGVVGLGAVGGLAAGLGSDSNG